MQALGAGMDVMRHLNTEIKNADTQERLFCSYGRRNVRTAVSLVQLQSFPGAQHARRGRPTKMQAGFGTVQQPSEEAQIVPHLPNPPDIQNKSVRAKWNATSMAFLGDSVWELYARRLHFLPPTRVTTYYENVVSKVRAETQEMYYGILHAGDFLTDEEQDILRWGGNAKVKAPPRLSKSGAHAKTYKHATALECLVGYLYMTDPQRLHSLMCHLGLA